MGESSLGEGPVICVVGARPNFMKMAPILVAFGARQPAIPVCLVHTGQHYDIAMNEQHFEALRLPRPDESLEVGSASHAVQTAEVMRRFEPIVDRLDPAAVLVVGDVNSTLACALVAAKKDVPVIHVEAGLRSFDRHMPEEINRVLTDQLAGTLFTTEAGAAANLAREGIDPAGVHFVGNVMIDSVHRHRRHAVPAATTLAHAGHDLPERYGVVTLHRPANVDDPDVLSGLLAVLVEVSETVPLVFPLHPRTRARIESLDDGSWAAADGITVIDPVDYLAMLGLVEGATLVLTDSGGLQEETTALGIPCLTLRPNTERPITVSEGTNTVVGTDAGAIRSGVAAIVAGEGKAGRIPARWDGHAAERIAAVVGDWLAGRRRGAA